MVVTAGAALPALAAGCCFPCASSLRVASCNNPVSTSSAGNWTYRITDPRIKQFLTESCNKNSTKVTSLQMLLLLYRLFNLLLVEVLYKLIYIVTYIGNRYV